jgi:hypothetical protein
LATRARDYCRLNFARPTGAGAPKCRYVNAFVFVAVAVAALSVTRAASAAGSAPLPVAAPPPAGTPASSTLRDALTAIEQAAATNPSAAQNARFFYNAALEQYNAHEYEQARESALSAIRASAAPATATAHSPTIRPAFPGPHYFISPDELPATPANAQHYVTSAHRAMASCSAPAAATEYRGALTALSAKQYRVAMADARNIVDDCSSR